MFLARIRSLLYHDANNWHTVYYARKHAEYLRENGWSDDAALTDKGASDFARDMVLRDIAYLKMLRRTNGIVFLGPAGHYFHTVEFLRRGDESTVMNGDLSGYDNLRSPFIQCCLMLGITVVQHSDNSTLRLPDMWWHDGGWTEDKPHNTNLHDLEAEPFRLPHGMCQHVKPETMLRYAEQLGCKICGLEDIIDD